MLISIFIYLFYYPFRQIKVKDIFKYVKMEIHNYNRYPYSHIQGWETWFILIAIYKVIICKFVKNVTSEEHKYISQMSEIGVYVKYK